MPDKTKCRQIFYRGITIRTLLTISFLIACPALAIADDEWNVTSGNWSDANPCPWSTGAEPTSTDFVDIANGGTANITLPGETCAYLYLGGTSHTGAVQMTGGSLTVGYDEYITSGTFTQASGLNTAGCVQISPTAKYTLSGGTLRITSGLDNQGILDLSNSSVVVNLYSAIATLSGTTLAASSAATLNVDSSSLLIIPSGHSVGEYFAIVNNSGIIHQAGSTLEIPHAYAICGNGTINDHVTCAGMLSSSYGYSIINLNGGLDISNLTGMVELGQGSLYVNDANSGMIGGSLHTYCQYIGSSGAGTFMHSGGMNECVYSYVGYNSGCSGTYNLSGGTHIVDQILYIGGYNGSTGGGTYNLSGTGQLTVKQECIASSGTGAFIQTGGTNNVSYVEVGASGTYALSAGTLNLSYGIYDPGVFDISNSSAVINAPSSIIVLSGTVVATQGTASLNMDAHSLLIVPKGFDPAVYFKHYTPPGILHQVGSALDIPSTYSICGASSIPDHVNCTGSLKATLAINLNGGLTVSGTGNVDLGGGSLKVDDQTSAVSGGSLYAYNQYVGYSGTGTFTQTGGTNAPGNLYLGYNSGSNGTYALSGTGSLSCQSEFSDEYIGYSGTGTFVQTGGINAVQNLYLGYKSGSQGLYTLTGGSLSAQSLRISAGRFEWCYKKGLTTTYLMVNSGTLAMYFDFNLADLASGTLFGGSYFSAGGTVEITNGATATQSGTTSISIGGLAVGSHAGSGTYNQTGGTNSASIYLGYDPASTGTYNLSGTGHLGCSEYVGYSGTGMFNQSGGTNAPGYMYCGYNDGAVGTYNQTAGTNTPSYVYCGFNAGATGTYYLSSEGQLSVSNEYLGYSGSGTLNQTGGTNTCRINLGFNSGSSGAYYLNGGTLITKSIFKGSGATAFYFGGGTLQASGTFTCSLPMTLTGDGGNANFDTAGNYVTLSAILSGDGGLNKLGSGTLTLSSKETYAGNTTVNGGTLAIAGGIDPNGTSLIDVQSGTAALKTVNVNKTNLNINTAALAKFEVVNGMHTVGAISGSGITQVDAGASLTAQSISQGTLTIGSGATLTIQAIPSGPLGNPITPVPETSTLILLSAAFILAISTWARKQKS
jgi:autotransporter-associated beta strand protein